MRRESVGELDRQKKMSRNHKTRSYPIFKEGDPVFVQVLHGFLQVASTPWDQYQLKFSQINPMLCGIGISGIPVSHPTVDQTRKVHPKPTIFEMGVSNLAIHQYPQQSRKPLVRLYHPKQTNWMTFVCLYLD